MARNLIKSIFLLVLSLVTVGLLSFCLISDMWIKINTVTVEQVRQKFENDYLIFTGEQQQQRKPTSSTPEIDSRIVSKLDKQKTLLLKNTVTGGAATVHRTTPTSTKMTITTTTTIKSAITSTQASEHDYEEADYDYQNGEDHQNSVNNINNHKSRRNLKTRSLNKGLHLI